MAVKITTLIENSPGEHLGLKNEHGISFLIEKDGSSYLFDTGQTGAIVSNAARLGLDLSSVSKIMISHGHYDHSGGLLALLDSGNGPKSPEIVVHRDFFVPKYGIKGGRTEFLGNGFSENDVEARGASVRFVVPEAEEVGSGVYVVGGFNRIHTLETVNPRFKLMVDGLLVPDDFGDEIMLVIETPKGLVLLAGCSHPGIMNMIDTVKERFGKHIYAVIGGTHLVEADEARLDKAVEYFSALDCDVIGVSHCTGENAMQRLGKDRRFFHNRTGSSLIVS